MWSADEDIYETRDLSRQSLNEDHWDHFSVGIMTS